MTQSTTQLPYEHLTPDVMLDAVSHLGLDIDGRMQALGSYENRVYMFYTDHGAPIVVKFYRPNRWTTAQIEEEHVFAQELLAAEVPAVAPLNLQGHTLHTYQGFMYAVYPCVGGRPPELDDAYVLEWIGRFMGRIHAIGKTKPFQHRPALDITSFGTEPMEWLLANGAIPLELETKWQICCTELLSLSQNIWDDIKDMRLLRLHGDCHPGNILWREPHDKDPGGPHFVDLDDARMGPAVQDLWMLLSGTREMQQQQLSIILSGYEDFCEFDWREVKLIEVLRTLRMIHYSAWLARRWDDPAFPRAFPWFGTHNYWQEQIQNLQTQIELLTQ